MASDLGAQILEWLTVHLWREINYQKTLYFVAVLLVGRFLTRTFAPEERSRLGALTPLMGIHGLLVVVASFMRAEEIGLVRDVRLPSLWLGATCAIGAGLSAAFAVVLPRVRLAVPRLLQDLVFMLAAGAAFFAIASRLGVNLSGLIATSAVLTAVIGLSLQDTLGNIVGGVAIQMDRAFQVGDWIKFGDVNGRVVEIRWRYTAIETRNWETVIVPNKQLLQGNVSVVGMRQGQPRKWRRWVWFNVDYRYAPTDVIRIVSEGLAASPMDNVCADPPPNVVMMDFAESYGRYAVRYWLTDFGRDDPTDSLVRARIYFSLKRAGIRMSIPAHTVFVNEEQAHKVAKQRLDDAERKDFLRRLALFESLSEDELDEVTRDLKHAPFSAGEIVTRQGNPGRFLYVLVRGEVKVSVASEDSTRDVATLKAPSYFGEMSLMTGEPRSATITAVTDAECYRLAKATFERLLQRRPELAERLATSIAERRTRLAEVVEDLSQDERQHRVEEVRWELVEQIRSFFGIREREKP
jgi:small-conductance mechanosensitive channel/CRP-like cAMP-binding protein